MIININNHFTLSANTLMRIQWNQVVHLCLEITMPQLEHLKTEYRESATTTRVLESIHDFHQMTSTKILVRHLKKITGSVANVNCFFHSIPTNQILRIYFNRPHQSYQEPIRNFLIRHQSAPHSCTTSSLGRSTVNCFFIGDLQIQTSRLV